MKPRFFNPAHTRTPFVQLNTSKCKACWKCLDNCPNKVIDKVNLPWHKHALIINPIACTGCLKCIKTCEYDAYMKIENKNQDNKQKNKKVVNKFVNNNLLLIVGIVMAVSGLVLQLGFHMGNSSDHHGGAHNELSQSTNYEQLRGVDMVKTIMGLNYSNWSVTHKTAIVIFSLLMIYHIYDHWKWYKAVISKHLIGENFQVITLTILFVLVAITGLVPWFIDLSGSKNILRLLFIEIHDKLALILVIYLILHFVKRIKWFNATYVKLKG